MKKSSLILVPLCLAFLIVLSFNASRLVTAWAGFSPRWYGVLAHDRSLIDAALLELMEGQCEIDPDALAAQRETMRARVRASPLCDGPRFGRALGMALRHAWLAS